jgi:putative RNA 2'-phosphotransferase
VLYHGTSAATATRIRAEGLRPMRRQYVHLSVTRAMAESVGRRKGQNIVVLTIDTVAARAAGVEFLRGNEFVWLAEQVPAKFLT